MWTNEWFYLIVGIVIGILLGVRYHIQIRNWMGDSWFKSQQTKPTGICKGTMYIDYNICGYAILIATEDIAASEDRIQIAEFGTPLYDELYSKCRFTSISAFEKDIQARQRIKLMAEELSTLLDKTKGGKNG